LAIRALIADDHAVVREGIQGILEANSIEVVGQASDKNSALALYKSLKPDVLVLDISMPGSSGTEAVSCIIKHDANAKIVIFSIHENTQFVDRILAAGAMAYVTKGSELSELVSAIKTVCSGKTYIASELAQSLVFSRLNEEKSPISILSEREFNIFCLVAEGKGIPEIAKKMFLAEKTVANYIGQIKQKLQIKNSAELVHLAIQNNLIQLDGVTVVNN